MKLLLNCLLAIPLGLVIAIEGVRLAGRRGVPHGLWILLWPEGTLVAAIVLLSIHFLWEARKARRL